MQDGIRRFRLPRFDLYICVEPALLEKLTLADLARIAGDSELVLHDVDFDVATTVRLSETELLQDLQARLAEPDFRPIVLSDKLVHRDGATLAPTSWAMDIRKLFARSESYCGLAAITSAVRSRAKDVDAVVDHTSLDPESLRRVLSQIVSGMLLRSKPTATSDLWEKEDGTIRLVATANDDELVNCFQLRCQVYDTLGYLPDDLVSTGLDIDSWDANAVHLCAFSPSAHRIVGTARLISPRIHELQTTGVTAFAYQVPILNTGNPTLPDYHSLVDTLVSQHRILKKYTNPVPQSLPLLRCFDFQQQYGADMIPMKDYAELSRVVVHPDYRGCGISTLLINAVALYAHNLGCKHLLLECAPFHCKMYQRSGFMPILVGEQVYYRRQAQLDQIALAMRRELTPHVHSPLKVQSEGII